MMNTMLPLPGCSHLQVYDSSFMLFCSGCHTERPFFMYWYNLHWLPKIPGSQNTISYCPLRYKLILKYGITGWLGTLRLLLLGWSTDKEFSILDYLIFLIGNFLKMWPSCLASSLVFCILIMKYELIWTSL